MQTIILKEKLTINHSRSLTSGKISSQLLFLAIPLLMGNIFQQLYNVAAAIIVGRYVGEEAFAAIGVGGTVMNLFIFILTGCCIGVSIIIASLFGKGDYHSLRKECFLALAFGTGFTIVVSATSIFFMPSILKIIHTPPEILEYTQSYLNIILGGLLATFFYNLCAAALRAVGNTKYALVFLITAVLLNATLTFVLVAWFGCGITGAAWATVFSQALSALFCIWYIKKKLSFLVPTREDMKYDSLLLRKTIQFASLSAIHQSSLYIGKLLVQGAVNLLGTAAIAAFTATGRIEGITSAFGESGGTAISVFVAHNSGAGNKKRALEGFHKSMILLVGLGFLVSFILFLFARPLLSLFLGINEHTAISEGISYLRALSFFYVLCYVLSDFVGYFRGSGQINIPFIGTTIQIIVRVILSYWLTPVMGLKAVAWATGIGWITIVLYQMTVFFGIRRRERKLETPDSPV